jgi:drug/metabolite transporter superfamily protein YnfA
LADLHAFGHWSLRYLPGRMKSAEQELPERQLRNATAPAGVTDTIQASQPLSAANIVLSVFLFLLAGILEVGGGYLVWRGIRDKYRPELFIPLGSLVLVAYGFAPTLPPLDSFGRLYAIYGGFFIVLSYAWGYVFDGMKIDLGDFIGSAIALAGVLVCWFWPR